MLSSALFGRSRTPGLSTDDKTKLEVIPFWQRSEESKHLLRTIEFTPTLNYWRQEMTNLVDQATSDILNSVDWSANMQLVDQINCTSNPFM